jgi:hypothetical protein
MKKFSCKGAKAINMVEYLAALGYYPAKPSRGTYYWYLSPLPNRNEKKRLLKLIGKRIYGMITDWPRR